MIIFSTDKDRDISLIGGKAAGLFRLIDHGCKVPAFLIVCAGTNVDGEDFAIELISAASRLAPPFAVRSSGVGEDGSGGSFAGQFSTELGVETEGLVQAVRRVALSASADGAQRYASKIGQNSIPMAVVVQQMIEGEISGVMFTTSPFNGGEILIEYVEGRGENLVGGKKTPVKKIFKKGETADGLFGSLLDAAARLEAAEGKPLDIEWTYADGELYFLQMRPATALGDELPPIPDRNWREYVYRQFCLFCHGVQALASRADVQKKVFGFSVPIKEGLIVNCREFYSPESDADSVGKWRALDKGSFIEDFAERIDKLCEDIGAHTERIRNGAFGGLSSEQLRAEYALDIALYVKSYVPMMMRPDDYLETLLFEEAGEDAERIVKAASIVSRPTYYSSEQLDFLLSLGGDGKGYLEKYSWTKNPLGVKFAELTRDDYVARASKIDMAGVCDRIGQIRQTRLDLGRQRDEVFASIQSPKVLRIAGLINRFVYLRTCTAETSDRFFFWIRKNLLSVIADRYGIDRDELLLMSPGEVDEVFEGYSLTFREKSKRRSGELIVINDGESSVYYSSAAYSVLKKLRPVKTDEGALKGDVACPGEVTAKVKIVNNFSDALCVEDGCILVAPMTTPSITSALDGACGIITDEGGISCHAAIIAREYAIPCLVGTKIATSVLKDGMTVHLDCASGGVTILEEK